MKKVLFAILASTGLLFCFSVFAQVLQPPTDLGSAASFLPAIIAAFKNGQYLAGGALLSLILTWAIKMYILPKLNLGNGWLPIIAAVVGIFGGVGLAVANGGSLGAAALAVLSGPLATALYEAVMQYILPAPAVPAVPPA